jgi:hypothetical protein
MLAEVRRARHGALLALHVLRLCAAERTPTEIARVLFCSRSSVDRIVHAYYTQRLAELWAVAEFAQLCGAGALFGPCVTLAVTIIVQFLGKIDNRQK